LLLSRWAFRRTVIARRMILAAVEADKHTG
jgi:hypothetical protein